MLPMITAGLQVGSAITGFLNSRSNRKAQLARNKAILAQQGQAVGAIKDSINFYNKQFARHNAVYGDIENNLANYYNNLNPERFKNKALAANAREFQKYQKDLNTQLAARGLDNAGLNAELETMLQITNAEKRAGIIEGADDVVAQRTMQFFNSSRQERQNLINQTGGSYARLAQVHSNNAGNQPDIVENNNNVFGDLLAIGGKAGLDLNGEYSEGLRPNSALGKIFGSSAGSAGGG